MSALLSFLGGSAFRAVWGEISSAWSKYQDHKHELQMMEIQAKIDAQRHEQQMAMMVKQSELGVKTIEVQSESKVNEIETEAWLSAVKNASAPTGIHWLDVMRGSVQPVLAYIAIIIWISAMHAQGWHVTDWDKELVSAIFGMYLANRHLVSRGK
jgi:hypothetical protein